MTTNTEIEHPEWCIKDGWCSDPLSKYGCEHHSEELCEEVSTFWRGYRESSMTKVSLQLTHGLVFPEIVLHNDRVGTIAMSTEQAVRLANTIFRFARIAEGACDETFSDEFLESLRWFELRYPSKRLT